MADMRFLRPSEVIERLKATVKGLGGVGVERIGGVEDFDGVEYKARLAPPALYVQLNPGSGTNDSLQTGIQQTLIHEFEIVFHLDKTDRRG